jgi:hypothetical protein
MKNKRNQDGISAIELEKKNAIRIDAILSVTIDAITSLVKTNPVQPLQVYLIIRYFLFSMLLFMVVVLFTFFGDYGYSQEIILILEKILPGSETLVIENMQNILMFPVYYIHNCGYYMLWSGLEFSTALSTTSIWHA